MEWWQLYMTLTCRNNKQSNAGEDLNQQTCMKCLVTCSLTAISNSNNFNKSISIRLTDYMCFFYNQKALILYPLRAVRMKDWVNIYAYYPRLFLGLERQSEAIGIIWTNFYLISKILMKFNIRFKFSQPFIVHLEKNLLRNFFYIP